MGGTGELGGRSPDSEGFAPPDVPAKLFAFELNGLGGGEAPFLGLGERGRHGGYSEHPASVSTE